MKLDNSQAKAFLTCGLLWQERYAHNLEPRDRKTDALDFGTRLHELLECRHKQMQGVEPPEFPPLANAELEAEAQLTLAAYEAYYPEEPFEVVGVERYFEVGLPDKRDGEGVRHWECSEACGWGISTRDEAVEVDRYLCPECGAHVNEWFRHTYCGEFDAIVRMKDSGRLWLLETKTEKRGGKGNLPESWQQRSQVSLYTWAAAQVYGEEFEGVLLNVVTRQSPKGQERPSFRRDNLVRTKAQQLDAVKNITWVADEIERCEATGFFPSNRNACVSDWGWRCDYLKLHQNEERLSDELVQIYYKEATPYLSGL